MSKENELYTRIGRSLYAAAPESAKIIVLEAELSAEDDHVKFMFDYVDELGNKSWFEPNSSQTDSELMDCLVELRKYYVENNLTNDHPAWHSCEVKLDVEQMKLNIEFKYED
ncbi:hypothetical protein PSI22_15875 [Xenorhabdus sp. XENO-7]|uniref:DUF600 family protein n=1 Tax=Xenorhabdus aichiensis TaxID=3025874 RepID=A0ABT5M5U3_9GAMM|nr:hypothetical protein [Xenorhabdus aichiensis]